ncbi:hypothetical protein [Streptomyces sp. NBC_01483]|uniref:hypothetical protein n=1 Tax=Streptomyces sp. NBC_01483 TaxID=2903883 RepID=UPI002E32ADE9|nr:hypothetical protein [Streptomyces sp. NBC_01483]
MNTPDEMTLTRTERRRDCSTTTTTAASSRPPAAPPPDFRFKDGTRPGNLNTMFSKHRLKQTPAFFNSGPSDP